VRKSCLVSSLLAAFLFSVNTASADDSRPFNGAYVGLHAGYAWQGASGVFDNANFPTSLTGLELNGGIVGGQIGYNIQPGWWMVGLELDATAHPEDNSITNLATNVNLTSEVSYLASIRGRLGFVVSDVLIYGTAGVGFVDMKFTESVLNTGFYGSLRERETGAVYGGGVEFPLIYGVTLRGEYLHYDVGTTIAIPNTFPVADNGDYVKFSDIDVARAALNISLNP
jgi:outer membrane immunogenic protein